MKNIMLLSCLLGFISAASAETRMSVPYCGNPSYKTQYEQVRRGNSDFILTKRRLPVVNESNFNSIERDDLEGSVTCLSLIQLTTEDGSKSKLFTHEFEMDWKTDDLSDESVNIRTIRFAPLHY